MNKFYILLVSWFLVGCATKYPCQEPGGITCKPVSEVYSEGIGSGQEVVQAEPAAQSRYKGYSWMEPNNPVRTKNKTVRIWLAPWVDGQDVFHDQSYLYMVVRTGHWLIEDSQQRLRDKYKALQPKVKKPLTSDSVKKP